ncbi:MAG: NYN domain-containing protein [Candidatus Schekmanbacteria bacterium]|nr:NYN domain-containing protein [Candidatus Schekmanbacteria bacterium]
MPSVERENNLALFIDYENIALGIKESGYKRFDVQLVLARLLEKGKLIVKRAYADWERYKDIKLILHDAAIELIEIPQRRQVGKNSADIRLCVDAMDLCYSKVHIDYFAVASGDSDFSPLVSKLKENDKRVIGLGVKHTVSSLLVENCDEFIYYEDLIREEHKVVERPDIPNNKVLCFELLVDATLALMREGREVLWGSMVKQAMKRKRPDFAESFFGYTTFSQVLEDAARFGLIGLRTDPKSGTYVITGVGVGRPRDAAAASAEVEAGRNAVSLLSAAETPAPRRRRRRSTADKPAKAAAAEAPEKAPDAQE